MTSKNLSIKLGCATAVIVASIPVVLVLNWLREPFGSAQVVQSTKPLGLAEAKRLSGLPFPDSARNIRYAFYSQWVAYEIFVRFEAPVADCVAFAERLINNSGQAHDGSKAAGLSSFDGPIDPTVASSSLLETAWFDIHAVRHGLQGGSGPNHSPTVWVDTKRGVCYYKQTD